MATVNAATTRRSIWPLVGSVVVPLFAVSIYLWFSRWPTRRFSTTSDYPAFAVCIAIGLVFVVGLPIRLWLRVLAVVVYVPLVYTLPFLSSLLFVGLAFGDWL